MTRRPAAAALLMAVLAVSACSSASARTTAFGTLAEAEQAGAIAQGLLPAGLPDGTRDIRVGHVPGQTQRWGLFEFPPEQGPSLAAVLQPQDVPLQGQRPGVPSRIEWWPVALRGTLDGERLGQTGLKGYKSLDGVRTVAVNWQQGRAYFWQD